jgi:hypothetical protein
MTLFVTVIAGLILVIFGLSSAWPLWVWAAVGCALLVLGVLTGRFLAPDREAFPRELLPEPDLPLPGPGRQEERVAHVALPSSVADYDFSFAASVRWLVLDAPDDAPCINAAGLAVDAVLHRARVVTAQQPPHRSAFAQHQLDGALATMRTDATGRVAAMALNVSLGLPEPDRERLTKLSNVRKDEDVWEHERNYERSKRSYFGDDVLKDPGSAVVWWLSRNEQEVEGAVDRIGLLAQLSAAANNATVAAPFEHLVPPRRTLYIEDDDGTGPRPHDGFGAPLRENGSGPAFTSESLFAWFGFSVEDPDLTLFAARLARLADTHGKGEAARRVRSGVGGGTEDGFPGAGAPGTAAPDPGPESPGQP